jgi:hypothetical protein
VGIIGLLDDLTIGGPVSQWVLATKGPPLLN